MTKTKTTATTVTPAADLAAAILAKAAADEKQAADQRRQDLATYQALVTEIAGHEPEDRSTDEFERLTLAAQIIGDRLGYDPARHVAALDAMSAEAKLINEVGNLREREGALQTELQGSHQAQIDMNNRHHQERTEFGVKYQNLSREQARISTIASAADAARLTLADVFPNTQETKG